MGIFSDILGKIFPASHPSVAQPQIVAPTTTAAATPAATASTAPPVDVEQILTAKAAQAGQPLNWKTSIVDLMKLLGLDSSLDARKSLATELHYTGSTADSATMNVWLIKQVMSQLAANGGKVPASLMS